MTRCYIVAAALVVLCVSVAQASRYSISEVLEDGTFGRDLLQRTMDCKRVHPACKTCRNQRKPGSRTSELVCSTCEAGWRLRRDRVSKTCDCAPGFAKNATGDCAPCELGKYCVGGDASNDASEAYDCPAGLETTFVGAKSQAQCFTQPGYGRKSIRGSDGKVSLEGEDCPVGSYNVGGNTAGCQRCGAGLTTASQNSDAPTDCVAPAGSYLDKGVGKLCQKGTYSTALNSNSACTACPAGITTADEGSTSADDCSLAVKGYYLVDATTAAPCPVDTYNDEETASGSCKPCPHGWRTKTTGADGLALCLAPPGWELLEGNENITECPVGKYKADWNRNSCSECGTGLDTAGTGSVSKDACRVPAGFGLTSLSPMEAAACTSNTYGDSVPRPASAAARCTACPPDMYTLDTLNGTPTSGYTSETDCLVGPGYGTTSTLVEKCPVGTYNAGLNREPCKPCSAGMTTLDSGKTSAAQCVVQAGWEMQSNGLPHPCDKGTYSLGGDEASPNATCVACSTGYSTQTDESTSADDCAVCAAGYGGAGCAQCGYDTFSFGGSAVGMECTACASGSVSRRRSTEAGMCYSALIDAIKDVFSLSSEAAWTSNAAAAAATTAAGCGSACTATTGCATYRFGADKASDKCQLLVEDTAEGKTIGFKINNGVDYVLYKVADSLSIGVEVSTLTGTYTAASCSAACTAAGDCEVFALSADGSSCSLRASELDEEYTGMFAVRGDHLASDAGL